MLSILARVGLLTAVLAMTAGPATAAGPARCFVKNATLELSYVGATGSPLQDAIDAAGSGNTLEIAGRCVGNFIITDKSLTLVGKAARHFPKGTLDANGSGRVLYLDFLFASGAVTLTDLRITGGSETTDALGSGGGILNLAADLTLNGATRVIGNSAVYGAGIFSSASFGAETRGSLTLSGSARVSGNTAEQEGGGISANGPVTLNDSARIDSNTSAHEGGGIISSGVLVLTGAARVNDNAAMRGGGILSVFGTTTLNGSAQVSGNTAEVAGGGIYIDSGTVNLNDSSSVHDNIAGVVGGGIYIAGGVLNGAVDGGNVINNKPDNIAP
jgi:predicted outer membrane repeat protein